MAISPTTIKLPYFPLPSRPRAIDVHPSIIHAIDALVFARRGPRLDLDVFAKSADDAFCFFYELRAFDDLASFNGLYMHDFNLMPEIIAAAASHQAFGVFIVPVLPDRAPFILPPAKSSAKAKPAVPWFNFLMQHSLLSFNLSRAAFAGAGSALGCPSGVVAVLAQFGRNGRFKTAKGACKEKSFSVSVVPGWPPTRQLQPVAHMWPRCSPLADSVAPSPALDDSPPVPQWPVPADAAPVVFPSSPWNAVWVRRVCADYPFPRVFNLAVSVMEKTLDPFVGQRDFPVLQEARSMSEEDKLVARGKMVASVERGNMDGPRSYRVFPNARDLPFGLQLKHRYIISDERRLTSDASAQWLATASINKLTWSPHMRRVHAASSQIRDMMAWVGCKGSMSLLDIPKAFRAVKLNPKLAHLFVYNVITEAFGSEFFCDLADPFGWIASEWGWQCCLAMMEWIFYKSGVRNWLAFVDNLFFFHLPLVDDREPSVTMSRCPSRLPSSPSPLQEGVVIDSIIDAMGLGRHEQEYDTPVFSGLGWDWSWIHQGEWPCVMICQEDKYNFYLVLFRKWSTATKMSVKELEQAVGIMSWLIAGFPCGAANITAIAVLKSKGKRICQRFGQNPHFVSLDIDGEIQACFAFWAARFASWDRICPVVMGFGPCSRAQARGWVDACTWRPHLPAGQRGGCGGVFFDVERNILLGFAHEWTLAERGLALREVRESSTFYEALGIEMWLSLYGVRCRARRTLLATDSDAAMLAMKRAYSDCGCLNEVVGRIRAIVAAEFLTLRLRSVIGVRFNIIADHLSHGRVSEATDLAWRLFGLRMVVSLQ